MSYDKISDIYEVNGHLLAARHGEAVLLIHDDEQKYKIKDKYNYWITSVQRFTIFLQGV